MPSTEFRDRPVLVTGAGRGIGKRLAMGFARMGAKVALIGRNKAELELAHIEIEQAGGSAIRVQADVVDAEQMELAGQRARVSFGQPVEILICAAGVAAPLQPISRLTSADWRHAMDVNLMGVVHATRAVLPSMMANRRGKIIVLACECDGAPHQGFSAYSTSKMAAVRFIEALACEVLDYNVQANCFDSGPAYTSLTDEIIKAEDRLESKVVAAAREVRRTGGTPPESQLDHVAFLASERSNHVTGKLIHVSDDWKKLMSTPLRPDVLTLRRLSK